MIAWMVPVLFLLLALPELPGLLRRGDPGEIAAFASVWAAGLVLAILVASGAEIDGVTKLLRSLFEPLGKLVITPPPS